MLKENTKFTNEVVNKIYKIIQNKKIDGVSLFPMLRKEQDKLYLGTLVEEVNPELLKHGKTTRPKYWMLLDINTKELVSFEKTSEKDYMKSNDIPCDKVFDDEFQKTKDKLKQYELDKTVQYKNYLMSDMRKDFITFNQPLLDRIDGTIIVDGDKVSATDYLLANIEEELEEKIKELVGLLFINKYSSIIYYYQTILEEIVKEYQNTNNINMELMNLAMNILDVYYGTNYGIKDFFNI